MWIPLILNLIFLPIAALHFYWALGGSWGLRYVLPQLPNQQFSPPPWASFAVGLCFLGLGLLYALPSHYFGPQFLRYSSWVLALVFALRALGDFRYVGWSKTHREGDFALWDDFCFSPLVAGIALLLVLYATGC